MTRHCISHIALFVVFFTTLPLGSSLEAVELPREFPLWEKGTLDHALQSDVNAQVRSYPARPGSPSGSNRVFSSVSSPTASIHRPQNPNGVGLVICPGGGFRDVWIDREGHDLAIWLKDHGVTCLVLKYRTRPRDWSSANAWQNYQRIVQSDGRQAIRILRKGASDLGVQPDKIGICGFSAGGHLALSCALYPEPKRSETDVSSMPDFAGLFYLGIPDDISQVIERRTRPEADTPGICPLFIMNARNDRLTPEGRCVDFYAMLLKAQVKAELHIFGKGSHGIDMGTGRGKSAAIWPRSFVAWLRDTNMIQD